MVETCHAQLYLASVRRVRLNESFEIRPSQNYRHSDESRITECERKWIGASKPPLIPPWASMGRVMHRTPLGINGEGFASVSCSLELSLSWAIAIVPAIFGGTPRWQR